MDFIGSGASIRFSLENSEEETPKQSLRKEVAEIIRKYEKKSASVCEICGAANAERRNISTKYYYVKAVCDKCYDEYMRRQAEAAGKRKKDIKEYLD